MDHDFLRFSAYTSSVCKCQRCLYRIHSFSHRLRDQALTNRGTLLIFKFNPQKAEAHMAKSVNKVILVGNLGKDPEVKYTPSGVPVAKFSIATNERFKDKAGEWQDRTEWHNIVVWQRLAEIIGEYVKKGSKVYIEGRLQKIG